jgi:hypothetical protein
MVLYLGVFQVSNDPIQTCADSRSLGTRDYIKVQSSLKDWAIMANLVNQSDTKSGSSLSIEPSVRYSPFNAR